MKGSRIVSAAGRARAVFPARRGIGFIAAVALAGSLLAACSSTAGIEDRSQDLGLSARGTLEGRVGIGPICPVEREGVPCPVPPETYAAVRVVVTRAANGEEVARVGLDGEGRYRVDLAPGQYSVTLDHELGIPPGQSETRVVDIRADETVVVDFEIDTGIR